jgi:hypothetical protein
LIDDHTLFDYNVGLNEIIQLLVRSAPHKNSTPASNQTAAINSSPSQDDDDSSVMSDKENQEVLSYNIILFIVI